MGLNRGGGALAFQKIVNKVSDLPSPLDAEPGKRIIVRETEEVYGLNANTRMWEPIGTLKKVGGKRPEELAAHVDTEGNPHKTGLQGVLDAGSVVKVSKEIVINGKGPASQIRLMSGGSALRVGPDAGSKSGVLWLNVGSGKKTILRAVNADGDDMMVLSTDGLVSGGSATFRSYKGLAEFEDEIVANEGVMSSPGYDLVLAGDKGVLLKVGGKDAALLTDKGLVLKKGLGLTIGNLSLAGQISGNLIPAKKGAALGGAKARWDKAAVGDLDVAGQVLIRIPNNSKNPPLQVTGSAPGHGAALTALGRLGLGTDVPEARLDVRGAVLIDGVLKLDKSGLKCGDWSISYGDHLRISRAGKNVLKGGDDGVTLAGAKVEGDLAVTGSLNLGGVSGRSKQALTFKGDGSTAYKAKSHQFAGSLSLDAAKGADPLTVKSAGDSVLSVASDGALLGSKLGRADAPWDTVHVEDSVNVGGTAYRRGKIAHAGEFIVEAKALVAGPELRLVGESPSLSTLRGLKIETSNAAAVLIPGDRLEFSKPTKVTGVSALAASNISTKGLSVAGSASLCGGAAAFSAQGLNLTGGLNVGGLAFKKVEEELELAGERTPTKFKLPAGVRIEAVIVKLKSPVTGARFLQVGDLADADRFASPSTSLSSGSVIRALTHCDRGQSVQKAPGAVVDSGDAPASGKVLITVYYVDPAAN
jgi:hypothetical protein